MEQLSCKRQAQRSEPHENHQRELRETQIFKPIGMIRCLRSKADDRKALAFFIFDGDQFISFVVFGHESSHRGPDPHRAIAN